jgi:hypothetical protein
VTDETNVVVDGSNIATEGRSIPSLAQLESAVDELRREMPGAIVIVVVDATFVHRIDPSERQRFEAAALRGEYVYPPAGAIGRGDAFLLRIAQKIEATVLSNDSFQEFHGEHEWLFDPGRLLGGTPVPGVGWIFMPRSPVRGPKSRIAVRDAGRSSSKIEKAIAAATKEAVEADVPKPPRKGKKKGDAADAALPARVAPRAVNDPLTFISFVAEHPLGTALYGEVESFTSHGAVIRVGEMHCYVPLSGLGNPPPRSAREVLRRDEIRQFVLTALDPQRRGVELALPEVAVVSGRPSEETVEADVALTLAGVGAGRRKQKSEHEVPHLELLPPIAEEPEAPAPKARRPKRLVAEERVAEVVAQPATPSRRSRARKAAAPEPEPVPEPEPESPVAPRSRSRRPAAVEVAEAPPAPARSRARKAAAPPSEGGEPVRPAPAPAAARAASVRKAPARKAAASPAAAPAPAGATRSRRAAAPAAEPDPPVKTSRPRKKPPEPEGPPPAKVAAKKSPRGSRSRPAV